MSVTVNPHQRKVFQEDRLYGSQHPNNENGDFYESISDEYENDQLQNFHLSQKIQQPELPPEKQQSKEDLLTQYATLKELIEKLNDEDHSEDEGIEDYKIGGYHPCHVGEVLINRYVLIQKLGWGHFSTVWLAKDFKYNNYAAVKIMKSSPHYLQVEILQKVASYAYHPQWIKSLKQYEPNKQKFDRDDCHVLNLLNSFLYKGPYGNHFCMVFQILGVNLLQVLKRYDYKGLPLDIVREITRQVLMGLDFLNRICRVIHTDLKPENVLLCLTEQQIKKIVESGQLANQELYRDRLWLYRTKYQLGPQETSEPEVEECQQKPQQKEKKIQSDSEASDFSQLSTRIEQLKEKLQDSNLNKNQRKNYRRKLKKIEEKLEKKQKNLSTLREKQQESRPNNLVTKNKNIKDLFSAFSTKLVLDKGPKLQKGFKVKIADLGNACWQHHHFATEIQTRQYRGPEVLTGSNYNLTADMWSLACMTFQMLTGELLFNPRKDTNDTFGKNDDHLAQMMELLGRFPRKFSIRGAKSKKYFSKEGSLSRIPKLQNWSLKDVMIAKYRFKEEEAQFFQEFMTPMLQCEPERRKLSDVMLKHPWIHAKSSSSYVLSEQQHIRIKAQRYDLQVERDENYQYESENQDAETEDNGGNDDSDDEFFGYQKVGDIRYIDRSFMDLGYIGYGDGIFLQKLDFGPNWQFQA